MDIVSPLGRFDKSPGERRQCHSAAEGRRHSLEQRVLSLVSNGVAPCSVLSCNTIQCACRHHLTLNFATWKLDSKSLCKNETGFVFLLLVIKLVFGLRSGSLMSLRAIYKIVMSGHSLSCKIYCFSEYILALHFIESVKGTQSHSSVLHSDFSFLKKICIIVTSYLFHAVYVALYLSFLLSRRQCRQKDISFRILPQFNSIWTVGGLQFLLNPRLGQ